MSAPLALLGVVLLQATPAPPVPLPVTAATTPEGAAVPPPAAPSRAMRRYGIHIGLNATLTVDAALGSVFYAGFTTQLTGLGFAFDTSRNFTVSALAFAGVALPLADNRSVRVTLDATPMLSYLHSEPVNLLSVGVLAGLRVVHSSGFTAALRLPLVGYTGAPDAPRGGLLYYYIAAIPTVPVITVGYTF